jgi:hypothetical protein
MILEERFWPIKLDVERGGIYELTGCNGGL